MTTKQQIRQIITTKLQQLPASSYLSYSETIQSKTIEELTKLKGTNILIYLSASKLFEPTTSRIVLQTSQFFKLYAPVIINHEIKAAPYHKDKLVLNKFGILEPIPELIPRSSPKIDVAIVPVLAFDSKCNRLGRGLGYYDKFLSNNENILKIGLAFEIQKVANIPTEAHDVPLDLVITEQKIYRRNK